MDELLTPQQFAIIYDTQIKMGNLYNYPLSIQYENSKLMNTLVKECVLLAEKLSNGYFTDAHWFKEPLATSSAYHLYCMQIIKE